jgi:hypothetical protein
LGILNPGFLENIVLYQERDIVFQEEEAIEADFDFTGGTAGLRCEVETDGETPRQLVAWLKRSPSGETISTYCRQIPNDTRFSFHNVPAGAYDLRILVIMPDGTRMDEHFPLELTAAHIQEERYTLYAAPELPRE